MTDLVSIVIPSNRRPCLAAALDSIRRSRNAPPCEIVVVGELPPDLPPLDPARNERFVPCSGIPTGPMRNLAVREARGDLVLFTDSDCVVDPDWLARAAASCTPDRPIVAGGIRFPEASACDCGDNLAIFHGVHVSRKPGLRRPWGIGTNNLAVRRDVFDALGGFDSRLSSGEDAEFLLRAAAAGHPIWFDPSFAVRHDSGRTCAADIRGHARWYAEGSARLAAEGLAARGRFRADRFLGSIPGATAAWSALKATTGLLGIVLPHPPFWRWRILRAWPWAWLFLYTLRLEKFRAMRAALAAKAPPP